MSDLGGGVNILNDIISGGQQQAPETEFDTLIPPEFLGSRPYQKAFGFITLLGAMSLTVVTAERIPAMRFILVLIYLAFPFSFVMDLKTQYTMRGRIDQRLIQVMGMFYMAVITAFVMFHIFIAFL